MTCSSKSSRKRKMSCGGKVKKMACGGKVRKMATGGSTGKTSVKEGLKKKIKEYNENANKAMAKIRERLKNKTVGLPMPTQLRGISKKK